jgi:hypothetical protein
MAKLECPVCKGLEPADKLPLHPASTQILLGSKEKGIVKRAASKRAVWKDFKFELRGYKFYSPPHFSPPHVPTSSIAFHVLEYPPEAPKNRFWLVYNDYLITYTDQWSVRVHWWPEHGFIVSIHGLDLEHYDQRTFTQINRVLKDFAVRGPERRGNPKITNITLIKALKKLGLEATQTSVATELEVTTRALQLWAGRNGLDGWSQVRSSYKDT